MLSTDLEAKRKVGYLLPVRLIRAIKDEANQSDVYPSHVVEAAIKEYLERRRSKPEPASAS